MDDQQFDAALRALQAGTTRRAGLAGALGVLLGGRTGALAGTATPGRGDEARAQAAPESGGWGYQSQFGRGCGSTTRYCLGNPNGISVSADGTTAYVADDKFANQRIAVYVRDAGSTTWYFSHAFGNTCGSKKKNRHFCLGLPQGLSVSADGTRAYVSDSSKGRIAVYVRNAGSTTWYYSHEFGKGNFSSPFGISVSADERMACVADWGDDRIVVFTRPHISSTTWTLSTQFGSYGTGDSNFKFPRGVFVSADTLTAWVSDTNNNRISIWTRPSTSSTTWSYSAQFGSYGSGDSNFNTPTGGVVSADTLTAWVADSGNNRIAVWARADKGSTAWSPSAQFSGFGTGASKLKYPINVAVSPDGLTALVNGANHTGLPAGVVEIWTQS